ncbi:tetratricopeptide repeat protein [Rhodohalobacter sp. 614A]|uniref:tetratricopeptide repeat protein n=1 Tax=Rhodohalobacter sp. 614A TaxID=2908649 RepID=UPI001F1A04AC|nr:tetratricopeptide repeat protein [Rhodohalobacter sp. 614A]
MMRYLSLLVLALFLTGASVNDARKANEAFENGNYEQAAELYQRAIEEDPDNARLHFNLASTLHKLGRTEEAMQAYDRFENLTESSEEQSYASYNQGNILTEEDKYKEAAEYYREALKKNPNDPDARHNYELALQRQQQQEQQQQNQDSNQDQDQENQDQQEQQQGNDDQNQDQNQDQQPPNNGQQQDQQEQEEQRQPQPQPTEMTPEEAQNILDALEQLERELLENMKKESSETQSTNDKDW